MVVSVPPVRVRVLRRFLRAAEAVVVALASAGLAVAPDLTGGFAAWPSARQVLVGFLYCVAVVLLAGTAFKKTLLTTLG